MARRNRPNPKKKTPASREPRTRAGRALGALRGRWAVGATWGLALVCVIGWFAGKGALQERVADLRSQPLMIDIRWPPLADDRTRTWMPVSERERLENVAAQHLTTDLFDHHALERTRQALLATGWFERIDAVRREAKGVVAVQGAWRVPSALVRSGAYDHVVSAGGVRLPIRYRAGEAGTTLRFIEGVGGALPEPGARWIGGEVEASLELLAALRERFEGTRVWTQVAGVDARRFSADGELSIVTDADTFVVWGSAPRREAPGEQPANLKLDRLARLAGGPTGRIDGGQRRIEIHTAHVYIDETTP